MAFNPECLFFSCSILISLFHPDRSLRNCSWLNTHQQTSIRCVTVTVRQLNVAPSCSLSWLRWRWWTVCTSTLYPPSSRCLTSHCVNLFLTPSCPRGWTTSWTHSHTTSTITAAPVSEPSTVSVLFATSDTVFFYCETEASNFITFTDCPCVVFFFFFVISMALM